MILSPYIFSLLGAHSLNVYDSVEVKENGPGLFKRLYELNSAKVIYFAPKYLPVEPQLGKGFVY